MKIPFSPPFIWKEEIQEVIDTLSSWWITSWPKVQLFEQEIVKYCNCQKSVCVSSASSWLELTLRLLWIGKGDEVIIPAYTYTATASSVIHTWATPIMCDIEKWGFNISVKEIKKKITKNTKAIIPVDFAWFPCDYYDLLHTVESKKSIYKASPNNYQQELNRIAIISDSAHSFWSLYDNKRIWDPRLADFTIFSFHAVKNLTTAEWWAICFWNIGDISAEETYKQLKLLSLQWQTKSALEKTQIWTWEYDILFPWYKANMTDIQASLGLIQIKKYTSILERRKAIFNLYKSNIPSKKIILPEFITPNKIWSFHFFPVLIENTEIQRDTIIKKLYQEWISTNVHFKPLPLFTAYKNLWYKIEDYPESYKTFKKEISLPLYPQLKDYEVKYICSVLSKIL